ncbi:hypothetical protein LY78DRAFT_687120 [Colletotrichum sublineola]|nr:hypothetical protein LY78DRAFT_687120 [Colletotrichum sublineola]
MPEEERLQALLLQAQDGFNVTPYAEDTFSEPKAERDFHPVTHGQARFTRLNVVDKFGQVVSPMLTPALSYNQTTNLYPYVALSITCHQNVAKGSSFANSVNLNNNGTLQYKDPVWGWLVINFRSRGIQIYNADGKSIGKALLPNSISSKVYYHNGSGINDPLSTLVNQPMALVNIGLSPKLAIPVIRTHSYADIHTSSKIKLNNYKFKVLLGHKSNLCGRLVRVRSILCR